MSSNGKAIYEKLKRRPTYYDEETHCPMILNIMLHPEKGRMSAFCVEAGVSEQTFWNWLNRYDLFLECYALGKMYARENWEKEGLELAKEEIPIGKISHRFEHWRLIGWSRFGVSKNARIRLDLKAEDNPNQHYAQLIKQASNGDFTASEIKQLMEAINVGLNTHQVFALQKEIDELKSDLLKMHENQNGQNTFTNKRIAEKD